MVTEKTAKSQVLRLSGLPFFQSLLNNEMAGAKELQAALRDACRDDQHGCDTVSRWLRGHSQLPTPADFYQTAHEVAEEGRIVRDARVAQKRSKCRQCDGTGWMPVYELVTWESRAEGAYRRMERIGPEQYSTLRRTKLGGLGVQEVYSGVTRCACSPAAERVDGA